jgi:hypothetical protein
VLKKYQKSTQLKDAFQTIPCQCLLVPGISTSFFSLFTFCSCIFDHFRYFYGHSTWQFEENGQKWHKMTKKSRKWGKIAKHRNSSIFTYGYIYCFFDCIFDVFYLFSCQKSAKTVENGIFYIAAKRLCVKKISKIDTTERCLSGHSLAMPGNSRKFN